MHSLSSFLEANWEDKEIEYLSTVCQGNTDIIRNIHAVSIKRCLRCLNGLLVSDVFGNLQAKSSKSARLLEILTQLMVSVNDAASTAFFMESTETFTLIQQLLHSDDAPLKHNVHLIIEENLSKLASVCVELKRFLVHQILRDYLKLGSSIEKLLTSVGATVILGIEDDNNSSNLVQIFNLPAESNLYEEPIESGSSLLSRLDVLLTNLVNNVGGMFGFDSHSNETDSTSMKSQDQNDLRLAMFCFLRMGMLLDYAAYFLTMANSSKQALSMALVTCSNGKKNDYMDKVKNCGNALYDPEQDVVSQRSRSLTDIALHWYRKYKQKREDLIKQLNVTCNLLDHEILPKLASERERRQSETVVILCNPNAGFLECCYFNDFDSLFESETPSSSWANFYSNINGYDVLMWNYRGFGDSHGVPSPDVIRADGECVLEFATRVLGYSSVIIHGESMGGMAACHIARYASSIPHSPFNLRLLVADRTFCSLSCMANSFMGPAASWIMYLSTGWSENVVNDFISSKCHRVVLCDPHDEIIPDRVSLKAGTAALFTLGDCSNDLRTLSREFCIQDYYGRPLILENRESLHEVYAPSCLIVLNAFMLRITMASLVALSQVKSQVKRKLLSMIDPVSDRIENMNQVYLVPTTNSSMSGNYFLSVTNSIIRSIPSVLKYISVDDSGMTMSNNGARIGFSCCSRNSDVLVSSLLEDNMRLEEVNASESKGSCSDWVQVGRSELNFSAIEEFSSSLLFVAKLALSEWKRRLLLLNQLRHAHVLDDFESVDRNLDSVEAMAALSSSVQACNNSSWKNLAIMLNDILFLTIGRSGAMTKSFDALTLVEKIALVLLSTNNGCGQLLGHSMVNKNSCGLNGVVSWSLSGVVWRNSCRDPVDVDGEVHQQLSAKIRTLEESVATLQSILQDRDTVSALSADFVGSLRVCMKFFQLMLYDMKRFTNKTAVLVPLDTGHSNFPTQGPLDRLQEQVTFAMS